MLYVYELLDQYVGKTDSPANIYLDLIKRSFDICLFDEENAKEGTKLAQDYCKSIDKKGKEVLDTKSIYKIDEIVRFMFTREGIEDHLDI
mgnify:FL=1